MGVTFDDRDESEKQSAYRWTDVFSRSAYRPYGFAVRRDWQSAVRGFVREHGSDLRYSYLGGMTSYAGETWAATLLDGRFIHTSGTFWHYGVGTGNGMWLSGYRAVRYVLYTFDIPQPRRLAGESVIPSYEELAAEAVAMSAANPGTWKYD